MNNRLVELRARECGDFRLPVDAALTFLLGLVLEGVSPVGASSGDFGWSDGVPYAEWTPREVC